MFVCQWHRDIPYGKQAEALAVMRVWLVFRVLDERPR
jgi:hypothetical protein